MLEILLLPMARSSKPPPKKDGSRDDQHEACHLDNIYQRYKSLVLRVLDK
jgi:hypothetical protein